MTVDADEVLPYRTDVALMDEWLEARARGLSAVRLREASSSPKAAEGVAATASALGLVEPESGALTQAGRGYALAGGAQRRALLREAMLRYAPYREVMRAVAERGGARVTEIPWLEAWWGTQGYGNSPSNRREGAAVFGKLVEFTGLGRYIAGRRGHATRIEWEAGTLGAAVGAAENERQDGAGQEPAGPTAVAPKAAGAEAEPERFSDAGVNRVCIPLEGGRSARLEVPTVLPSAEKQRLLALLDLLIREEPPR